MSVALQKSFAVFKEICIWQDLVIFKKTSRLQFAEVMANIDHASAKNALPANCKAEVALKSVFG